MGGRWTKPDNSPSCCVSGEDSSPSPSEQNNSNINNKCRCSELVAKQQNHDSTEIDRADSSSTDLFIPVKPPPRSKHGKKQQKSRSSSANVSSVHQRDLREECVFCPVHGQLPAPAVPGIGRFKAISVSPFVTTRCSSMYIDPDGDCAHEFYEEVPGRSSKSRGPNLVRIVNNLKPQGFIGYDIPRLHPDLPYILVEIGTMFSR